MKKILVFFIISMMAVLAGCGQEKTISTNQEKTEIPSAIETKSDSEFVKKLYELRKTKLNETDKIQLILQTFPYFKADKYDISVDESALRIDCSTGLRSEYRNEKEVYNNLKKLAVTLFALIEDANHIEIFLADIYGPYISYIFNGDGIDEKGDMKYFTPENIEKAVKNKKNFEEFLIKVLDIDYEKGEYDKCYEEIYKKLADDVEMKNPLVDELLYKNNLSLEGFDLKGNAEKNGIDLSKYNEKKLTVIVIDEENFINGKKESKAYFFKGETLLFFGQVNNKKEFFNSFYK